MNRKRLIGIFVLLLFSGLVSQAQNNDTDTTLVKVHGDPRIFMLMKKQSELNEYAWKNRRSQPGYRIQVINTRDREEAMRVKSQLLQRFPNEKSYLVFQSPYFKIQVGNFKERKDADAFREELLRYFPGGAFVVPATIEITPGSM